MGMIIINPGSGPVEGAEVHHAEANMTHFLADAGVEDAVVIRAKKHDQDGRFGFYVLNEASLRFCEVRMPGLSLDKVRYMGEEHQNIWHFPRLFINGDSWVWKFAIDGLFPEEDDDD